MNHRNKKLAVKAKPLADDARRMKKVVKSLRAEMKTASFRCFTAGQLSGGYWCQAATHADLRKFASMACDWIHGNRDWNDFPLPENAKTVLEDFIAGEDGPAKDYAAYAHGWGHGVHEFMAEVFQRFEAKNMWKAVPVRKSGGDSRVSPKEAV